MSEQTIGELELPDRKVTLNNFIEFKPLVNSDGWYVEIPTEGFEEFRRQIEQVLPVALRQCSQILQGARGIVKFIPSFETDTSIVTQAGYGHWYTDPEMTNGLLFIEVSQRAIDFGKKVYPTTPPHIPALGVILHEVFDTDYELRERAKGNQVTRIEGNHPSYPTNPPEVYANTNALKVITQIFGSAYRFTGQGEGLIVKK